MQRSEDLLATAAGLDASAVSSELRRAVLLAAVKLACVVSSSHSSWMTTHGDGAWSDLWRAIGSADVPLLLSALQPGLRDEYMDRCALC